MVHITECSINHQTQLEQRVIGEASAGIEALLPACKLNVYICVKVEVQSVTFPSASAELNSGGEYYSVLSI